MAIQENVRIAFQADASQALGEIKNLTNGFSNVRKETEKASKGAGDFFDTIAGGFAKAGFVIGGVREVLKLAQDAAGFTKLNAELKNMDAQLQKLGPGSLSMMQRATAGTVAELDLMRFGLKALGGELHLTQAGLDLTLTAAKKLSDQGFGETVKIAEQLAKVLRGGGSEELRAYGISIDSTASKQDQLNQLLAAMGTIAATPVNVDPQLEAINRLQASTANWIADFKAGLGEVFAWVLKIMDKASWALSGAPPDDDALAWQQAEEIYKSRFPSKAPSMAAMKYGSGVAPTSDRDQAAFDAILAEVRQQRYMRGGQAAADAATMAGLVPVDVGGQVQYMTPAEAKQWRSAPSSAYVAGLRGAGAKGGGAGANKWTLGAAGVTGESAHSMGATGEYIDRANPFAWQPPGALDALMAGSWGKEGDPDFLGNIGGGVGGAVNKAPGMMAELADQTTKAGQAYAMFSDVLLAGVDAAITGSESISKALGRAAAAALKSLALQASTKAIWETAEGIAAAATGNPAAASGHFAAAAGYAACAVAAGAASSVASSMVGGGAAAGASGAAGGGYAARSGGGGGDGATYVTVYVGDGYTGDPDALAEALDRKLKAARRRGRIDSSSGATSRE
jgi:hypothetical protein